MKVIILAGGLGTRISEYTKSIPKPMIRINNLPILVHIMKHFARYGYKDFLIATGYKGRVIEKYFKKNTYKGWNINVIPTGKNVMTGGRLKRLKTKIKNEKNFFLTYGDGLSNINLKKLVHFHQRHKKVATLSAVRPPARFGFIKLSKNRINYFKEKSSIDDGWINGGYMILNSKIFRYIKGDQTYLEKEPLEKLSYKGQLYAFKHEGFWQCMDTLRDKEILEKSIKKRKHLAK